MNVARIVVNLVVKSVAIVGVVVQTSPVTVVVTVVAITVGIVIVVVMAIAAMGVMVAVTVVMAAVAIVPKKLGVQAFACNQSPDESQWDNLPAYLSFHRFLPIVEI